ncbi:phosphopantetheine-binding protein [Pseudonocardia kujensis]|uniref:Pls/PosA family non-ribosomal peptide synthetase n=1 Tax=Pseudonocardia kujensis TaxID=1128675 RepID=UPI001E45ABB7|nr:Pls/PosA family non-ribosomal peptide synthetase [Pseudonocardia kujensis]MCE0765762.1 phosphopantetheine-binding protein [Pseudonocardia kujensis]
MAGTPVDLEPGRPGATDTETALAALLAEVMDLERVGPADDFFDRLGADSMVLARFCAKARKRPDLPSPSMRDVYDHPTVAGLAAALGAPPAADPGPGEEVVPAPVPGAPPARARTGTAGYVLCGVLQFLAFVAYAYGFAIATTLSYEYVVAGGPGLASLYVRAVEAGGAIFVAMCLLPILAKWLLVGRWRPREIRLWSLAYFRFWLVKTLVRASPLLLLTGGRSHTSSASPLMVLYLRALGARIGRGVTIYSRTLPVCTDLITLGAGTVVRKDAQLNGYRAHGGVLQTGPVTVGRDVVVGEGAVLDIRTAMGDGSQIGHASALVAGQSVPAGESWHGVPAVPGGADLHTGGTMRCGGVRRTVQAVVQLVLAVAVYLPVGVGFAGVLLDESPLSGVLDSAPMAFTTWTFYRDAVAVTSVLFFGALLLGLVGVAVVPRLLNLPLRPDRTYRLYGFHYGLHRTIGRLTNVRFFNRLFGDSSYIVGYLRWIGYDVDPTEQTGSNFGTELRQETPFHVTVGRGTMVADGLSIINADFSATSFRISRVTIGAHSFLGNRILYPSQGRTGENVLLATKVLVPMDGEVRHDTGLLGAPCFPIPRTVERDHRLAGVPSRTELRRRLSRKNRYNLRSMAVFLAVRWVHALGMVLLAMGASDLYRHLGVEAVTADLVGSLLFTVVYFCLVERAMLRFRSLAPRSCSIYDRYFWWHERFWKLVIPDFDQAFAGTPFKNLLSRALGVRLGRRVFDDGCFLPERTLVTIGDEATLNFGTVVQCHSQEDGAFKSDRSTVGARATLGVGAFVHYGVTVGEGAELDAGTFVMKGEEVPPGARWEGNPAREAAPGAAAVLTARAGG